MNFKVSKNFAEHLGPACGTLVFRGTVVGNHCPKVLDDEQKVYRKCEVEVEKRNFTDLFMCSRKEQAPSNPLEKWKIVFNIT